MTHPIDSLVARPVAEGPPLFFPQPVVPIEFNFDQGNPAPRDVSARRSLAHGPARRAGPWVDLVRLLRPGDRLRGARLRLPRAARRRRSSPRGERRARAHRRLCHLDVRVRAGHLAGRAMRSSIPATSCSSRPRRSHTHCASSRAPVRNSCRSASTRRAWTSTSSSEPSIRIVVAAFAPNSCTRSRRSNCRPGSACRSTAAASWWRSPSGNNSSSTRTTCTPNCVTRANRCRRCSASTPAVSWSSPTASPRPSPPVCASAG